MIVSAGTDAVELGTVVQVCLEQNHLLGLHGDASESRGFQGRQWASGEPRGEFVEERDEGALNVSTMRGKQAPKDKIEEMNVVQKKTRHTHILFAVLCSST